MNVTLDQLRAVAGRATTVPEFLRVAELALEMALVVAETPEEMQAVMNQLPLGDKPRHLRFSLKLQALRAAAEVA